MIGTKKRRVIEHSDEVTACILDLVGRARFRNQSPYLICHGVFYIPVFKEVKVFFNLLGKGLLIYPSNYYQFSYRPYMKKNSFYDG